MTLLTNFAAIKDKAIKAVIPPEQTVLSSDEVEIRSFALSLSHTSAEKMDDFVNLKQQELNGISNQLSICDQEISQKIAISAHTHPNEIIDFVTSKVQAALNNVNEAINARVNLFREERTWNNFRKTHQITHQADYPESSLISIVPILWLTLIEAVFNPFFYKNDNGLIGGFIMAVAIAAVNLCMSVGLGYLFRFHNLIKPIWKRNAGYAAFISFFIFAIYFNGVLSYFRFEYQLLSDTSSVIQLSSAFLKSLGVFFVEHPFRDMMSFILFFIGLVCSGFAFFKGYHADDRYPGYSQIDKKYKEAKAKYDNEINLIVPHKTIDQVVLEFTDIAKRIALLQTQTSNIKDMLHSEIANYQKEHQKINFILKNAIELFRQTHLSVLPAGLKAPIYFINYENIEVNLRPISILSLEDKIQGIQKKLDTLHEQVNTSILPTIKVINTQKPVITVNAKRKVIDVIDREAAKTAFPTQANQTTISSEIVN